MQELQIPNGYFQLWQSYLVAQGMSISTLEFLIPYQNQLQHVLAQPIDTQSSYYFFCEILNLTKIYLNRPQFIFEMVQYIRPEHFGVLGYMASRSESLSQALTYILRFSRLVIDGADILPLQIQQKGQELYLTWPLVDEKYTLMNEMTIAAMVHLAGQIFQFKPVLLLRIAFAHQPQTALYHYQKFYGCQVDFQQHQYAIVMNLESLDVKTVQADPSLIQLLIRQAEDAIASKPQAESVIQQLHIIVAEYLKLQQQIPKIEAIASELHISVRTLQRQLNKLNTSFKSIVEVERMKRCELLLQQRTDFSEISRQLGYSDQSALARAYKAHTSITLLQRKKQLK